MKKGILLLLLLAALCIFSANLTMAGKTQGVKCEPSLTNCFGKCVNLESDAANCGTCGMACPAGFICNKKRCVCPTGKTACNGVCVDLQSNSTNCGVCGLACTGGKVCSNGVCECPEGETDCDGTCIDTSSDKVNCGACGKICPTGSCNGGVCCPVAVDDHYVSPYSYVYLEVAAPGVLANDEKDSGKTLSIANPGLTCTPEMGCVLLNPDGSFKINATADATFTYMATDGDCVSNAATVTFDVTPND